MQVVNNCLADWEPKISLTQKLQSDFTTDNLLQASGINESLLNCEYLSLFTAPFPLAKSYFWTSKKLKK